MKVVADIDIPFLKGVLEPFADVEYYKGGEICADLVKDADALLVRTRTKCGRELLEGSKVSFVASATIGTDHLDSEWMAANGIAFDYAPGCNAAGVMQYVMTALYLVACKKKIDLRGKRLGVIGAGNTGGRVAAIAEFLGFDVLRNDPPKELQEGVEGRYCSLDYLLRSSDIISMHVPLNETTFDMANESFFSQMKEGAIFINASRGEVVNNKALLNNRERLSALVLDVWRDEPYGISKELLDVADIATPHIAGYSYEGKVNGTSMVVRSLANHFGIGQLYNFSPKSDPTPPVSFYENGVILPQDEILKRLLNSFPIFELDAALRSNIGDFEKIRSSYHYRREFVYLGYE